MRRKRKILLLVAPVVIVLGLLVYFLSTHTLPVLSPAGTIASKERHLMIIAIALAAIVVIPVYTLTILIAVRYRETNHNKAKYDPDWDHSRVLETIWWVIPMAIILVLSIITWNSSHTLNPYNAIASTGPTLNVEVVALDWKWLFIYPQQGVASVNRLELPVNTPVHFYLTSDTVMNSFWVPALAGQIYAMPGMTTQLNLEATKEGSFYGSSANISGKGFAGMNFMAVSQSKSRFNDWLAQAKRSSDTLNVAMYQKIARPSQNNPVAYYKDPVNDLFSAIINQYMMPGQTLAEGVKT